MPNSARVYDFLLGGRDNFAADRELAARLSSLVPHIRDIVQENKRFLARAVAWVAERDIYQFIDLGSGLPTSPSTHEVARAANPRASVTYVDNDPVVVNHLITVSAKAPGVSVQEGDFRDVNAVLAGVDAEIPACLVVGCVLHFFPAAEAADLLARYFAALAPGSYLIVSVICPVGEQGERGQQLYTDAAMPHYSYSAKEIAKFCGGFELVLPGVTDARCWRPGTRDVPAAEPRAGGVVLVCVARKPQGALARAEFPELFAKQKLLRVTRNCSGGNGSVISGRSTAVHG
jgi:SAM-dependent methyltransferase